MDGDVAVLPDVGTQVHAEVDDVVAEFGVDDAPHGPFDGSGGGRLWHNRDTTGEAR